MKVFFFHLMPYADVDLDEVRKVGTSWVKLSNRHYDPEKGAALYERSGEHCKIARPLPDPESA